MDTKLKSTWTKALRSGKYPQTTGALHRVRPGITSDLVGFCCLGVLCKAAGLQENADGKFKLAYDDDEGKGYIYERSELTVEQLHLFGMTQSQQSTLIEMNDEEEKDFVQIAKWVEENI